MAELRLMQTAEIATTPGRYHQMVEEAAEKVEDSCPEWQDHHVWKIFCPLLRGTCRYVHNFP